MLMVTRSLGGGVVAKKASGSRGDVANAAASFDFERMRQRVAAVVASRKYERRSTASATRGALRRAPVGPASYALLLGVCTLLLTLEGCAVGPDYITEPAPVPRTFKELKGWKVATPIDNLDRGEFSARPFGSLY